MLNKNNLIAIIKKKASLNSVTILSAVLFWIWMTAYSILIYKQFSLIQVIGVASIFLTILSLFTYFFTDLLKERIVINLQTIVYTFLLFFLMVLLISTLSHQADAYIHTFPLLEAEIDLGWHQDTAFHVSLIQSIMHFGYPSIAQHGTQFDLYHVLSHYVDALILSIVQIEPYDSYGLLGTFKQWLLVSSIAVFIATVLKKSSLLLYALVFILIAPIFTGTWHATLSHSLWFTSILVIFGTLKVFTLFTNNDKLIIGDLFFIFIIIVLITLGKISTGFMYASIIGLFLLFKYPKDKNIYILGIVLATFFIAYSKWFSSVYIGDEGDSYDFSILSFKYYLSTIFAPKLAQFKYITPQNLMILMDILILSVLAFLSKDRNIIKFLFATISSYFLLITLSGISVKLNSSDVFYFYLGFTYPLNLFVFIFIVYSLKKYAIHGTPNFSNISLAILAFVIFVLPISYVSSAFPRTLNQVKHSFRSIDHRPYTYINKKLPAEKQLSITKLLKHKVENITFEEFDRPLYTFRENIYKILKDNKVEKKDALLFVPKEIFQKELSKFGGQQWAEGMLLYAVVGVPMIHAINSNKRKAYAQRNYPDTSTWKPSNSFSLDSICKNHSAKIIIKCVDFKNLIFETHRCK